MFSDSLNIEKVQKRVQGLLKGCKCTKGCRTNSCGCRRQGQTHAPRVASVMVVLISVADTTEEERCRSGGMIAGVIILVGRGRKMEQNVE